MNDIRKMQKILKNVCKEFDITLEDILKPKSKYFRTARNEAIKRITKETNFTLKEIGEVFSLTPQGVLRIIRNKKEEK